MLKQARSLAAIAALCTLMFGVMLVRGQQPATAPTPVAISIEPASFDVYVGRYEDAARAPGTGFSIFREADKYYLRVSNQDKVPLTPSAPNKFFNPQLRFDIEFIMDSGNVTGARFTQGETLQLKRTSRTPEPDTRIPYKRTEAMIRMRDGVKLFTVIITPEGQTDKLPIYMERTPYGVAGWTGGRLNGAKPELAREGYIFVFQDIRGREDSEGVFEMLRPPRDKRDPKSVDESTDTYDTIEWLLKNVPNHNGRVGIAGVSYPGWLAAVALIDPHPALKASSPQAPVTDLWMGDDFMHNGAFRQTYAHEWAVPLESAKKGGDVNFDNPNMYEWYMPIGKLQTLAPELAKKSHSWRAFIEHPTWDSYWQARATNLYLKDTSVPTLIVGGWWDQEDMYGPLALYKALNKTDNDNQVFLVMGPWNHGGWGGRGRKFGAVDWGTDTGREYRENIQAPFFARHLKDKGNYTPAEASIYRSGANKWMSYDSWSPKNAKTRELYLGANGKLSFERPTAKEDAFDTYVSDPANPVPYRKTPILATYTQGSTWSTWLYDDQRFLADRKDVLTWQTEPLAEDFTITGEVWADLFASTSGTDSDWVTKVIDVYGADEGAMAGYQLMVAEEMFRGRYRENYEKAKALEANKPLEYKVDLRGNDHTFKKGHRIMVQVQSSWFPLYDRNPQTFVENIFRASPADFKPATQKVYRSASHPSHIKVSILGN
jgi:uncharacterized protein